MVSSAVMTTTNGASRFCVSSPSSLKPSSPGRRTSSRMSPTELPSPPSWSSFSRASSALPASSNGTPARSQVRASTKRIEGSSSTMRTLRTVDSLARGLPACPIPSPKTGAPRHSFVGRGLSPAAGRSAQLERQEDGHLRAAAGPVPHLDPPVVRLDDAAGDGEPEAGAVWLRGEEGREEARQHGLRDARTAVHHRHPRDRAAAAAGRSQPQRRDAGLEGDLALRLALYCVDGVAHQVQEYLCQLLAVAQDGRQGGVVPLRPGDAPAPGHAASQDEHVLQDGVDVHRRGEERGGPRQVEELAHEPVDALRLARDDLGVLARVPLGLADEELRRALQAGERVLDLVGQAGCQRLEVERSPARARHPQRDHRSEAYRPVEERPRLGRHRETGILRAGEVGRSRLLAHPGSLRQDGQLRAAGERAGRQADRALAAPAEQLLGRRVEVQDAAVRAHHHDGVAERVDDRPGDGYGQRGASLGMTCHRSPFDSASPPRSRPESKRGLERLFPAFAGADADDLLHRDDEDLPVADATRLGGALDDLHHAADELVGDDDLDLHLGEEVDHVLGATVELGMPLLAAEALHLGGGETGHADLRERLLHLIQLERLDDGFDLLHVPPHLVDVKCLCGLRLLDSQARPLPRFVHLSASYGQSIGEEGNPVTPAATDGPRALHSAAVHLAHLLLAVVGLAFATWAHYAFWSWRYRAPPDEDELLFAETSDGWRIALGRRRPRGPARGVPVLLVHGIAANRGSLDFGLDRWSLAAHLSRAGFDCFALDLRGHGAARP